MFSAAVTILLTATVQDLKSNSKKSSTLHLDNIQQILTYPNSFRASIPSESSLFSLYAICTKTFLFLSLLISLFVALLARLSQQWAHQYTIFTQQPGCSPTKRARVHVIFLEGISCVIEAVPTLLKLSIWPFIEVLIVWQLNTNQPVLRAVIYLVALPLAAYLWFTSSWILRPNGPSYSPLSPPIWSLFTGPSYVVLSSSMRCAILHFYILRNNDRIRISDGIGRTAENLARERLLEIDVQILISTLDALREDGTRAKFFAAIPGFFNSERVNLLRDHLSEEFRIKFRQALTRFLDRTLSSNLVPESVKNSQLIVCLDASHEVLGPDGVSQILNDVLSGRWLELLQSVEMARSLRRWSNEKATHYAHFVLRIVIQVVVVVRERNDHWISLVVDEFGVPGQVLRANISHGDSTSLSLLIHVTRRVILSGPWPPLTLSSLTNFDIRNARPELQREFCALWDELVQEARRVGPDSTSVKILREIRHPCIELHRGTDAAPTAFSARTDHFNPVLADPRSYRLCVPQEQTMVISVG